MDESEYFWLQCQAPAGNWVDNLGSRDFDSVLSHKRYLTGLGHKCRIVTKTINVLPECVEEHGPNNACSKCAMSDFDEYEFDSVHGRGKNV